MSKVFISCVNKCQHIIPENFDNTEFLKYFNSTISEPRKYDLSKCTKIGSYVFYGATNLRSINIPENITYIGAFAFSGCRNLVDVNIPNSITDIGAQALTIGSTTNKATITFLSTTPPSIHLYTFNADYLNKIIVPAGCGEAYKAATNWSAFADYIEEAAA